MSSASATTLEAALAVRAEAGAEHFEREAEPIARCCHRMAERFARGGRLVAFGATAATRSDARHVAVEFVHPVLVGKRALPALAVTGEDLAHQADLVCEPDDVALGFGAGSEPALEVARARGCETIAFGGEHEDPSVAQEIAETRYHVLWELVHVFLDRTARPTHDPGASSFLYPFLGAQPDDTEALVADVARSVVMKAQEIAVLREQTVRDNAEAIAAAAGAIATGGQVLALGNGGSATDAMDLVADLRALGRRALDLTDDPSILTALANDIGVDAMFSRQVIAYGRAGDVLVSLSTSGSSGSVLEALREGRRRGLVTVAFVGYDGGRVAAEGLADHVIVSRSEHIPRIQEAQATAYHVLCELVAGAES